MKRQFEIFANIFNYYSKNPYFRSVFLLLSRTRMKRSYLISTFLIVLYFCSQSAAQSSGFGLGIKVGEPTGLNGKYWLSSGNAVSATVGYSFISDNHALRLSADYLFYHNPDLIKSQETLPVFFGLGVRLNTTEHNSSAFGIRGVTGISWWSKQAPVDVFFEFAPVFNLAPSTSLDLDVCLGIRYFF